MNEEVINLINKYKTDNKLDILYINNIINLDIDDENFNERFEKELLNDDIIFSMSYNKNDIYYSIL